MKKIATKLISIKFKKFKSLLVIFQILEKKLLQEKKEPLRIVLLNLWQKRALFLVSFFYGDKKKK